MECGKRQAQEPRCAWARPLFEGPFVPQSQCYGEYCMSADKIIQLEQPIDRLDATSQPVFLNLCGGSEDWKCAHWLAEDQLETSHERPCRLWVSQHKNWRSRNIRFHSEFGSDSHPWNKAVKNSKWKRWLLMRGRPWRSAVICRRTSFVLMSAFILPCLLHMLRRIKKLLIYIYGRWFAKQKVRKALDTAVVCQHLSPLPPPIPSLVARVFLCSCRTFYATPKLSTQFDLLTDPCKRS